MIKPAPQPDSHGSRGQRLDALRIAREDFSAVSEAMEPLLEALTEQTLEDLRPQLSEVMRRLLDGTRIVVESAKVLPEEMGDEVEVEQRAFSERLLDFRRAMGSGSTDTIRRSLRADLAASATRWNRLLDGLVEHIQSTGEDA